MSGPQTKTPLPSSTSEETCLALRLQLLTLHEQSGAFNSTVLANLQHIIDHMTEEELRHDLHLLQSPPFHVLRQPLVSFERLLKFTRTRAEQ
ncbi:MAG: hypothetical protein ACFFCZ_18465 [Promethearchaeota archaeon]